MYHVLWFEIFNNLDIFKSSLKMQYFESSLNSSDSYIIFSPLWSTSDDTVI